MFPNTPDDLLSKWFKLEEERGETLDWKEIRQNFISDFKFQPANEKYERSGQGDQRIHHIAKRY